MTYDAFVSYSHAADGKLAPSLQASLQQFAKPWNRLRAMRVFVDSASLSANPELWPTIERALRESEYFILLASPASAQSVWVQREVDCWLALGRYRHLLIVLTEGEIAWSSGDTRDPNGGGALPAALHEAIREEPRYTDLRWARNESQLSLQNPRFADAVADLAAPIRGMSKDDLHGEHVRQHRKLVRMRRLAIGSLVALTLCSVAAAAIAVLQRNEARRQARIALGRQLAAQAEVTRTERAQLLPLSLLQGIESMRAFASVEADQAIRTVLARIPAVAAVMPHGAPVDAMAVDSATGHIATATSDGVVALWDRTGGGERRLTTTRQRNSPIAFSPDGTLLATIETNQNVRVWNVSTGHEQFLPMKVDGRTMRVAFSADSRMVAATSIFGAKSGLTVWSASTGAVIQQIPLRGAEGSQGLTFSVDGRLAAVEYARVRVWQADANTCRELPAPAMSPSSIADLRFSPDGKSLVAAGSGRLLVLESGDERGGRTLDARGLRHLAFSADGKLLAGAMGNRAVVWDTATWTQTTEVAHEDDITTIAFDRSGSTLATGSVDGTAALWSIPGGVKLDSMDHGDRVSSVAFVAGEERLATASADGTARIWQPRAEAELAALEGSARDSETAFAARAAQFVKIAGASLSIWRGAESRLDQVPVPEARRSAAVSANGERAAVAGAGDVVRVWDASLGREIASLPHPGAVDWTEYARRVGYRRDSSNESVQRPQSEKEGAVVIAAISADGRHLLTTRLDFVARLWDVASGRLIASQPYESKLTAAVFSPDGRFAALILDRTEFIVLGLSDGRKLFSEKGRSFASIAIGANGVIAVAEDESRELRLRLWRSSDWSAMPAISFKSDQLDIALSADGEFVGLVDNEDVAHVLRTRSGTEVARFTASGSAVPVFSPDSTLVAVAGAQRTVRIFDLLRTRERLPLAHSEDTPLIAFTPDSRYVATVGRTFVRILSTDTGEEAARFRSMRPVERIQFSHDGKYLATTDDDSTRIWLWKPDDMADAGCTRLRRRVQPAQWPAISGEPFAARLARACPGF